MKDKVDNIVTLDEEDNNYNQHNYIETDEIEHSDQKIKSKFILFQKLFVLTMILTQ